MQSESYIFRNQGFLENIWGLEDLFLFFFDNIDLNSG